MNTFILRRRVVLMDHRSDLHHTYPPKSGTRCVCTHHTSDTATQPHTTAAYSGTHMSLIPSLTLDDHFLSERIFLPFLKLKSIYAADKVKLMQTGAL